MKTKINILLLLLSFYSFAQVPAGYYTTATGTGYTLKTQLYNIIKDHTDNGYSGLYTTYQTSDRDYYYENDGTVLDMYSEKPNGVDPYNYTSGSTQRCGTYSAEGDCYNREHIIPQSVFSEASPMRNDAHFITPTDGKVNGQRSNYPHGTVATTNWTSLNGSKLGTSAISGYSGSIFEPIDEFKGDIARMYFYFATRYETTVSGYSYPMFNGTSNQVFTTDFLNMLLIWSAQDPVSQREIDRNNAIYGTQNNRNPYIDHPEYVQAVWNPTPDTQAPTAPTNLVASNATATKVTLNWTASTDNVGVTSYAIYVNGVFKTAVTATSATITGLTASTAYTFYVVAKDAAVNASTPSNTANASTTVAIIDTENPTAPTNLVVTSSSSNSVTLTWNAATDNVEVSGYDLYMDSVLKASVSGLTTTITSLTPSTTYKFYVVAKDAATNQSTASNTIIVTTTAATPPATTCGSENFENMPANSTSYTGKTWTNNGITWTATDSRTDQVLNTRALTIRNGSLTSSVVNNGIHDLTVTTQLIFTGTSGTFNLRVNGLIVGSIPYSSTLTTTTIPGIDFSGNVTISFTDNSSTTNRVRFDDLSWSCYNDNLSTTDFAENNFVMYPNPNNGNFYIENSTSPFDVEIYNLQGQKLMEKLNYNEQNLPISNLNKGVYLVKVKSEKKSTVKKIIVE